MYFSFSFLNYVYRIGLLLTLILLVMDLLAFFYYPDTIFGDIFLATREQTPLTWISALAIFFVALSGLAVYFKTKRKIWYFLSVTFFFFSVDDATYLHERISGFLVDNTVNLGHFPTYIWAVLYSPLLLFSLGAIIYLLWRDSNKNTKKFVVIAISLLGFAIFLDLLDGFILKETSLVFCLEESCNSTVLHLIRLIEEIIEVIALGIIGYINIREHLIKD